MIQSLGLVHKLPQSPIEPAAPPLGSRNIERTSILPEIPLEETQVEPLSRIAFYMDPAGLAADRFRYLRMRLKELQKGRRLTRLLITSPLPQDGKSTVALNLATTLAERGQKSVLLIEADLYHPSFVPLLGVKSGPGLVECITNGLSPLSPLRRIGPFGWYLLPAGNAPESPGELLHGEALSKVMQTLTAHFDWILIDSPPVALLTDALALAQQADGTLLVARAGQTPQDLVNAAIEALGPKHVLGVLLNGVPGLQRRYSKYHRYYRKLPPLPVNTGAH